MVSGTIVDYECFCVEQDCEILHMGVKRKNPTTIISVLSKRSNAQRQEIKREYQKMWDKDLYEELREKLKGDIKDIVLALLKTPNEYDASELYDAIKGAGTSESVLIEILCSRSNMEIEFIKDAYKRLYRSDFVKDIQGEDLPESFKRLMYSLAQGNRSESEDPDLQEAKVDAQHLYDAGEACWGTDESRFNVILASRSFEELQAIFRLYQKISKKTIEEVIKSEMAGNLKDAMLAIVKNVKCRRIYFAEQLYKSMKGAGCRERALTRVMVSRSELDLVQIEQAFEIKYGQHLEDFIKDDTSGDYQTMLLSLLHGNR